MLVRFRCKDCGQKYQVPDNYANGEFRCIECNGEMEIPENSTLNDRLPMDFGNQDARQLVEIPVNMKTPNPANILKSEKELIEERIDPKLEAEHWLKIDPELEDEQNPETDKTTDSTLLTTDEPPSPKLTLSPTLSPASSRKLFPSDGSSLQIKPPDQRAVDPLPLTSKSIEFSPDKPQVPNASIVLPGSQFCANHPHIQTTSSCNSCNSPICLECRKEWGYYCSAACRDASLSTIDRTLKTDQAKKNAKLNWVIRGIKIFLLTVACIILGYIGMWVWRQFLDPGGKVAWNWERPIASLNYLSVKPDRLVILLDGSIITLDPQTGKIISSFNNQALTDCPTLQKKMTDKILVSGEKKLALVDLNAKTLWETSFKDPILKVIAGTETALVITQRWVKSTKIINTRYGRKLAPPTAVTYRYALDFKQRKKLWSLKTNPKVYLNAVAVEQQSYVSVVTTFVNEKSTTMLQVNALSSNKKIWGITLPGPLTLGPLIYKGNIIFRINDSLNAISIAGKKIWNAEISGYSLDRNFAENDGLAFFGNDTMLTVFNMDEGKILWSKPCDVNRIAYIAGRIFIRATEEDKEYKQTDTKIKLPPAYEKLKNEEPAIKTMFANKNKKVKYDDFIICLDAHTGKQLWKSGKVRGRLIVGFARAVMFRDTAGTSIFSAISNSDGKSVIGQLDLKTGEWLFDRNDNIGIAGSLIIAGNKLIGLVYDRNAGHPTKNMKHSGLAAFNLK